MQPMEERVAQLMREVEAFVPSGAEDAEQFRIRTLGRNGSITQLFDDFKSLPPEQKKALGQPLNQLKNLAQEKVQMAAEASPRKAASAQPQEDITRPGEPGHLGARHPLSLTREHILSIFQRIGFSTAEGPEIEDDFHNFSALNFPEDHPARDMQDTFFLAGNLALRTHTSSVQVRVMEQGKPPFRMLAPGRVYRNEAISARAHCQFHQVEGFVVDQGVSFAELKETLLFFSREMFGAHTQIRLRPSYFPFTEPSAEMDVSCMFCQQKGCNICKHSGWVEILGCGMIDPAVLQNVGIDPEEYSGFAFGMGIERIAMLRYGVNDLRHFFENDQRFLQQFSGGIE